MEIAFDDKIPGIYWMHGYLLDVVMVEDDSGGWYIWYAEHRIELLPISMAYINTNIFIMSLGTFRFQILIGSLEVSISNCELTVRIKLSFGCILSWGVDMYMVR